MTITITEQTIVVITNNVAQIITAGIQGPEGAQGIQGPQGEQGDPGPQLQELTLQQWNLPIQLVSVLANTSWDCNIGQQVIYHAVENSTLGNPANIESGAVYQLRFIQNAVEYKTLALGSAFRPAGNQPLWSTALGAVDVATWRGTENNTLELIGYSQNVGS